MVNVEDLKLLDTKTMKQSPQFQDLKNQFPQAFGPAIETKDLA